MPKLFLLFINSLQLLVLIGLCRLTPTLSKRNVVLGVTLSEEGLKSPALHQMIDRFKNQVTKLGIFFMFLAMLYTYFYPRNSVIVTLFVVMLYIVAVNVVYVGFHKKIQEWKVENGFIIEEQKIAVDLKMSTRRAKRRSIVWYYIPSLAISIIPIILSIKNYDLLPEKIPTHYNFYLEPDSFGAKSMGKVLFPYIFSILMVLSLMACHYFMRVVRKSFSPKDLDEAIKRAEKADFWWGICFALMSFLLSLLMGITYLPMSGGKLDKGVGGFITLLVLCSVILPILVGLKVGTSGERLKSETAMGNNASYDDDGKWLWGMFYYNPNDPATLVPKKVGIGYTINVATTAGKIFIAVILLIILFSILLPFIL